MSGGCFNHGTLIPWGQNTEEDRPVNFWSGIIDPDTSRSWFLRPSSYLLEHLISIYTSHTNHLAPVKNCVPLFTVTPQTYHGAAMKKPNNGINYFIKK